MMDLTKEIKLKQHETFWSKIFNETNIEDFKGWVHNNSISRQWLSRFLQREKIRNILDVGCGIALDYEQYLEDGLKIDYHGIDITPVFLKHAKEKFPNLDVRFASVENIPYSDRAFEVVSCRHLLEHLENPARAISEMTRISSKFVIIAWFIPPVQAEKNNIELMNFGETGKTFYQNTYCYKYLDPILKSNALFLQERVLVLLDEIWTMRKLRK